jgi:NAD(P)H-dependent FMN reductase
MSEVITIAVIAGTARAQRLSPNAAHYIADFGRRLPGVEIIYVDPTDFHLPGDGNDPEGKDARYTAIVEKADAFFIVTPEYNHSFPGSLKRLLDSELAHYNHKPVAIAGVSNGNWGGVRAVEQLCLAIRELGLVVMSWDMYFPYIQNIFDEQGTMNEEFRDRYDAQTAKLYGELLWFAQILKAAREHAVN